MSLAALPVELLSYVFTLSDDPCVLACVCKHWLRVARNTPRLWTRICVTTLDMRHVLASLALSKSCPLDILIDARDDEWDFSEPEIATADPRNSHNPLLAPGIVRNALSILTPHLFRWRSLTILTDTWAPMYLALNIINPVITTYGSPNLESLTLMRCNDFVSFSPAFRPRRLMLPAFLSRTGREDDFDPAAILPKLKHLHLTGVHLDWSALASAVEHSQVGGLTSLSLGSHSIQIRPNGIDFARILQASPGLEELNVTGSGPIPLFSSTSPEKVRLDKLRKLVIGYRSLREASVVFDAFSAPGVKEMVIEDVSHPADVHDVDGNDVLAYLLTEQEVQHPEEAQSTTTSPFSEVEELTLKNVKLGKRSIDQETLRPVLNGAKKLRRLVVEDIPVEVVLLSLFLDHATGRPLPCPELENLTVKTGPACTSLLDQMPEMRAGVWFEMTKRLVEERAATSSGLKQVKISSEHPQGTSVVVDRVETVLGKSHIVIDIENAQTDEVEDEDEEGEEEEAVAYLSDGTFVFDAYGKSEFGPLEHERFGIVV